MADDRFELVLDRGRHRHHRRRRLRQLHGLLGLDAIQLEAAGKPTVVATTTHFEPVATTLSTSFGAPDTRLLVLPHPIGGTDADTLGAWAEAATDRLIALFTTGA